MGFYLKNIEDDKDLSNGCGPKNIDANYSLSFYLARGTDYDTQYTSMTNSPMVANEWFKNKRLLIINEEILKQYVPEDKIIDLSDEEHMEKYLRGEKVGARAKNNAFASKEVVINGHVIPREAFIVVTREEWDRAKREYTDRRYWKMPETKKDAIDQDDMKDMLQYLWDEHKNPEIMKYRNSKENWADYNLKETAKMKSLTELFEKKNLISSRDNMNAFTQIIEIVENKLNEIQNMAQNKFKSLKDIGKDLLGKDSYWDYRKYLDKYDLQNQEMQKTR